MNKTNKILWLAIALLTILNLATIGTILYHNQQNKDDDIAIVLDENQAPLTGRYFRQTLGFDDDQMDVFRKANQIFQPRANNLIYEMDSLKYQMFTELNKSNPDTLRLNSLSEHIGRHHAELKKITNDFYLTIKSVCDASQCEQLEQAFSSLYQDETVNATRGYRYNQTDSLGRGRGYRHRYGRGWNRNN